MLVNNLIFTTCQHLFNSHFWLLSKVLFPEFQFYTSWQLYLAAQFNPSCTNTTDQYCHILKYAVYFSIVFCLYTALHYRRSTSSNFFVFHTSGGISLRPATFLLLIFFNIALSSAVNCSTLMSSCLSSFKFLILLIWP